MAMGKQKQRRQGQLWVETAELAQGPGHPFNQRLNKILDKEGFDELAEGVCRGFYSERIGRPSLAPAVYFRLLLIGYFEGIDSERGIAWRVADSITLRDFLSLWLTDSTPDHSTISRNRRLIDVEAHQEVFTWVLKVLAKRGFLRGKTLEVDATTLEANAALRSLVRRDSGESYEEILVGLTEASGIKTPTRAQLARIDRNRQGKGSNKDWAHPGDPDARITKMKDGRTHLGGHRNIHKRQLIHLAAFNLGLALRQLLGEGTPRAFQRRPQALLAVLFALWRRIEAPSALLWATRGRTSLLSSDRWPSFVPAEAT